MILEPRRVCNPDLSSIITPVNVTKLEQLLRDSDYDREETDFLVNGFSSGFDIGYQGPAERQSRLENIPFTVGNHVELWEKIMKEVDAKRVAGPFESIRFSNFIQSPVGLVLKAGNKTRMIFHLGNWSHP